jgi:uncharacterized protein YuzE
MRITYDASANAAYVYLVESIGVGGVADSLPFYDQESGVEVIVDIDRDRRVLGFELLSARSQLRPETLEAASPPGRGGA